MEIKTTLDIHAIYCKNYTKESTINVKWVKVEDVRILVNLIKVNAISLMSKYDYEHYFIPLTNKLVKDELDRS